MTSSLAGTVAHGARGGRGVSTSHFCRIFPGLSGTPRYSPELPGSGSHNNVTFLADSIAPNPHTIAIGNNIHVSYTGMFTHTRLLIFLLHREIQKYKTRVRAKRVSIRACIIVFSCVTNYIIAFCISRDAQAWLSFCCSIMR